MWEVTVSLLYQSVVDMLACHPVHLVLVGEGETGKLGTDDHAQVKMD